ncbi:MAG TPA: hypothetical protein VFH08_06230 [Chitinophagaceae bacterium]|nr:hypothetical protein [Chitinophagaceae bacterium]
MKKTLLASCAVLLILVSCQKEIVEIKYSAAEVLTPGQWKLDKLLVETPPGSGTADITSATFDPCELDDIIEFKQGGKFSCIENSNVCAINSGIFYNLNGGGWILSGDTVLTIVAGLNTQSFKFGRIAANSMELQQTSTNYLGELTRFTFLLKK